jgi:hypothetical protein
MNKKLKDTAATIGIAALLFLLMLLWIRGYSGWYQKLTGKSDPDLKYGKRITWVMFGMFAVWAYVLLFELIPGLTFELLEHNIWTQIGLGSMILYIPLLGLKFNRQ